MSLCGVRTGNLLRPALPAGQEEGASRVHCLVLLEDIKKRKEGEEREKRKKEEKKKN